MYICIYILNIYSVCVYLHIYIYISTKQAAQRWDQEALQEALALHRPYMPLLPPFSMHTAPKEHTHTQTHTHT